MMHARRFISRSCWVICVCVAVCCSVLWHTLCCSVLQCVAVCCSVLQCVVVRRRMLVGDVRAAFGEALVLGDLFVCCSVCCSLFQCVVAYSVLQYVAECCSVTEDAGR